MTDPLEASPSLSTLHNKPEQHFHTEDGVCRETRLGAHKAHTAGSQLWFVFASQIGHSLLSSPGTNNFGCLSSHP